MEITEYIGFSKNNDYSFGNNFNCYFWKTMGESARSNVILGKNE